MLPLLSALGIKSPTYQGHDNPCEPDDVPAVLERGSLSPVADEFFLFDYMMDDDSGGWLSHFDSTVPDGTIELMTMNQGLHHIPPDRLLPFLTLVLRKLCEGGVFLVREHDLSAEVPIEMLDLAHSVFNALTDVSDADEVSEVRAFRSIAEWKAIHAAVGFRDTLLMEMENGDPTRDMMMCFMKPGELAPLNLEHNRRPRKVAAVEPPVADLVRELLGQVPKAYFGLLEGIIKKFDVSSLRDALVSVAEARGWSSDCIESVSNMFIDGR